MSNILARIVFFYIFAVEKYLTVWSVLFIYLDNCGNMKKTSFLYRVFDLYYDGFRNMTLGKTLWAVILVKLIVIFVFLKLFFFPNFIKENASDGQEADFVEQQVMERTNTP